MIQSVRPPVASALGLFLLALLLVNTFSLECGLVRLLEGQRTSAQSKPSLSFVGAAQRRSVKSRSADRIGELFRSNCARCHGADGRGDTQLGHTYKAPDFTDDEWWRKHSNITGTRTLVSIVTRGRGGMPAFGKKLTRREIGALVNFVRRFRDNNRDGK
jgi:mono/diheme cytochrome c family protein